MYDHPENGKGSSTPLRVVSCLTSGRVSGVDVFATRLTRELAARGADARILLTEPDEATPDPLPLPADVAVDRLEVAAGETRRIRRERLREYLEARAPCVYIPNYDYNHSVISGRLSDGVTAVGIVHSDDPMHYDHVRRLGRYWNAIVAVSQEIARKTRALDPRFGERLTTIAYGVEFPEEPPARDWSRKVPLRALFAGRLEHAQKRVLDLPRILERLESLGVKLELTVVGSGIGRGDLLRAGRRFLEAGSLRVLEAIPSHRMGELYRQADLFLLTSAFEGLPVSMLESMAYGCVPIVTDVASGVPEVVVDGGNGFRLPVGDVYGFAARVGELDQDRRLAARLSQSARETISRGGYTLPRMVSQYWDLFQSLSGPGGEFSRPRPLPGEDSLRRFVARAERTAKKWIPRLLFPQNSRPLKQR